MKLDKNTWRIVYFMQKVTEFDDLPEERRERRFQRLMNYKVTMLKELKK